MGNMSEQSSSPAYAEPAVLGFDTASAGCDSVGRYLYEIGRTPLLTKAEEVGLAMDIEAGMYAARQLRLADESGWKIEGDVYDEFLELEKQGERAKDRLVTANLRLVVSKAKHFQDRGLELLDLIEYGNLGLIRAAEKFDYTQGFAFSTYADAWIQNFITNGIYDQGRPVRLTRDDEGAISKLKGATKQLEAKLLREPTDIELAATMEVSEARIAELKELRQDPVWLDSTIGEGESRLGEFLELEPTAPDPEAAVQHRAFTEVFHECLAELTVDEREILVGLNGLLGCRKRTQGRMASHLGVSVSKLNRLKLKAEDKFRQAAVRAGLRELVEF